MEDVKEKVEDIHILAHDQKQQAILDWLTPVDYAPQHNDFISRRQPGSGKWFLGCEKFQEWLKSGKQTLFCPGIPGAGKTMMSATVIAHLYQEFPTTDIGIGYIYCNFQRQTVQNAEDLLLSLLKQLAQRQGFLPASVKGLHEKHQKDRTRPTLDEISITLHAVSITFSRVFFVIDALDECEAPDHSRTTFLKEIFKLLANPRVNILITSRKVGEISMHFSERDRLPVSAKDEDVEAYLDSQMSDLDTEILDDGIRQNIKSDVLKAIDGMYVTHTYHSKILYANVEIRFLLAKLHMDTLATQTTKGDVKRALRELGKGEKGLHKTYEQAVERINGQPDGSRKLAWRILGWIVHSKWPLFTEELQHALVVRQSTSDLDKDFCPSPRALQSVCAGLVTIDKERNVVRLDHYTIQEFFWENKNDLLPNAISDVTEDCGRYLLFDVFESGADDLTQRVFNEGLQRYNLYLYAARNWGRHAREASTLCEDSMRFLQCRGKVERVTQVMQASAEWGSEDTEYPPRNCTGIHLAAYFGVMNAIRFLLGSEDPDSKDSEGRTPLSWASSNGHEDVVKLLLDQDGVEPDSRDFRGQTPLFHAVRGGHGEVVNILLSNETVNPCSTDNSGRTPLLFATERGRGKVVKLLAGMSNAEVQDNNGQTALSWAARLGKESIVKLLIGTSNADIQDKNGRTALSWAATEGQEGVVKLLVGTSNADLRDENGRTALSFAVQQGHWGVVNLIPGTSRVHVNVKDTDGRDVLSLAEENGYKEVFELLLRGISNFDAKNNNGCTVLSWAAENGYKGVVELLLLGNNNSEGKDNIGLTAMSWATNIGKEHAGQLLLEMRKADVDAQDKDGRTALSWAAHRGDTDIARILLSGSAASINVKDKIGRAPILMAAARQRSGLIRLLLGNGADIETRDKFGRRALHLAAGKWTVTVVRDLLDQNADIEAQDNLGRRPLTWAVRGGDARIVEMLLNMGADVATKDDLGGTPLSWAVRERRDNIVNLLLARGADRRQSNPDWTLLLGAAEEMCHAFDKLLSWVIDQGDEAVSDALIGMGANANLRGNSELVQLSGVNEEHNALREVLGLAAQHGPKSVFMLLAERAEKNGQDVFVIDRLIGVLELEGRAIMEKLGPENYI